MAACYSITSSARASSVAGTVSQIALADLRFMASSYLVGLHYRQVRRLLAVENPAGINPDLTIGVLNTGAVAHQPADGDVFAPVIDCGHGLARCQGNDVPAVGIEERIAADHQRIGPLLGNKRKSGINLSNGGSLQDEIRWPSAAAAVSTSFTWLSISGYSGFTRKASNSIFGKSSRKSPRRFVANSPEKRLRP